LKKTKMTKTMNAVINIVKDNEDYAEELARKLLEATSSTQVSAAFVAIKEKFETKDIVDPEIIINKKVENIMI
jgi:vacuolar-type H+-ATPase subunit D/Vma8